MINICFHGIGEPDREQEPGDDRYWITADMYGRILDEIVDWPGDVSISFDDGNRSDADIGLPGLLDRGLGATFFVLAGRIGQPGSLDRDGLHELVGRGMEVGTHGLSHRPWPGLDDNELRTELVTARAEIEAALGAPVTDAALPLGRYNRRVLRELKRLGYRRVYSSDKAPSRPDAWFQARYSVTRDDTPDTLRRRVRDRQGLAYALRGGMNAARKGWW